MWTYKHLSHCKSGHTITTRSCNAKEIPKKIPILDLSIHRHGSFSLSLSCQFINAVFLCFWEVSGCLQKESSIHPAMDNMTSYGKLNSWIELNSGAKWIVIESHVHWVKPPPSPTPQKNQIPSWLWGKSQSFLSSEGNRYCTSMLLFPWQHCMLCSTTYYYFHRIF